MLCCNAESVSKDEKERIRGKQFLPSKKEAFSPSLNQLLFPSLEHFHFVL